VGHRQRHEKNTPGRELTAPDSRTRGGKADVAILE